MDIWRYIARENLDIPEIYFAHEREVVQCGDKLLAYSDLIDLKEGKKVEKRLVRFRTVGDISCTLPIESSAATTEKIINELLTTQVTERGASRLDDRTSEASMELRKTRKNF